MEIIIKVRVKPILKNFVHWYERSPLDKPVTLSPGSTVAHFLNTVLTGKKNYHRYQWMRDAEKSSNVPQDIIRIRLNLTAVNCQEVFLSDSAETWFVTLVNDLHRDMLVQHVLSLHDAGITQVAALEQWMLKLGIEEDKQATLDGLKKLSWRRRQQIDSAAVFQRGQMPHKPDLKRR